MAEISDKGRAHDREAEALSLLDRLVDRYESEDVSAQDTAFAAAQSLCHAVWGSYQAGFEALARKIESSASGTVDSALRVLRVQEEVVEPGSLIRAVRLQRERTGSRNAERARVIERYGNEATARAPTALETMLIDSARALAEPGSEDDPYAPLSGWHLPWHEPPEPLRAAVAAALPVPTTIVAARDECRQWDQRKQDLDLMIGDAPGSVGLPTACAARHWLVERMWRQDLSATGPADLLARLEYWIERGGDDGSGYRILLADLNAGAGGMLRDPEGGSHARILRLKAEHPDWSLARIGQKLGISRQAVHKHLKRG